MSDSGSKFWETIKSEAWAKKHPIVAICKEGSMEQIRYAVLSDIVNDILFAPLEASILKRRINEYIKKEQHRT